MKHSAYRTSGCFGFYVLLSLFAVQAAIAAGVWISGSYEIIEKTNLGANVKVTMQLHLTNHESTPVSLQGSLLSDFAYPHSRSTLASEIVLRPGVAQVAVEEFVVPRAEFDQWKRGLPPRIVLELKSAAGARMSEAIRLEKLSTGREE